MVGLLCDPGTDGVQDSRNAVAHGAPEEPLLAEVDRGVGVEPLDERGVPLLGRGGVEPHEPREVGGVDVGLLGEGPECAQQLHQACPEGWGCGFVRRPTGPSTAKAPASGFNGRINQRGRRSASGASGPAGRVLASHCR